MALLRERLAQGEVTLRIKGERNGERTYFTFHAHDDGVPAGANRQDTRYDMAGLDGDNSAPANREFTFGLGIGRQSGASGGAGIQRMSVRYSTDDGATWHAARVRGRDGDRRVTVPAVGTGWVSLQVTAADYSGASVTETITRAYRVGCPEQWCGYASAWPHWPAG